MARPAARPSTRPAILPAETERRLAAELARVDALAAAWAEAAAPRSNHCPADARRAVARIRLIRDEALGRLGRAAPSDLPAAAEAAIATLQRIT